MLGLQANNNTGFGQLDFILDSFDKSATLYSNITPPFTPLLESVTVLLYISEHLFTHLCQYLLNVACLDEFLRANRLSAASKGLYAAED